MSKKKKVNLDLCTSYRDGRACTRPGFVTHEGRRYCDLCDPTPEGEALRRRKEIEEYGAIQRAEAIVATALYGRG
jgi:hypothetical protein